MTPPTGCSDLRSALDAITKTYSGRKVRFQIDEVERIRERFRHSIEVSVAVDDATPGPDQFTCFMHVLELAPAPSRVAAIIRRFGVFPSAGFVKQLVQLEWLIATAKPRDGDIVIYFDGDTPKHAGKCVDRAVESKWGLGHTWRHPVLEVPLSYGDKIRTFQRVAGRTAADWFVQFAKARVGADAIAALSRSDA